MADNSAHTYCNTLACSLWLAFLYCNMLHLAGLKLIVVEQLYKPWLQKRCAHCHLVPTAAAYALLLCIHCQA